MAKLDETVDLSLADLGLEAPGEQEKTSATPEAAESKTTKNSKATDSVVKADKAMKEAAANAALKAAIEANSEIAVKEAEKTYITEKKKFMLNKCKEDEEVEFVGQKIFANYFGPVYTFLYNTVPVTIKFDGSKQKLPRFVYNFVMNKINEVSDSNTNKVEIEER